MLHTFMLLQCYNLSICVILLTHMGGLVYSKVNFIQRFSVLCLGNLYNSCCVLYVSKISL